MLCLGSIPNTWTPPRHRTKIGPEHRTKIGHETNHIPDEKWKIVVKSCQVWNVSLFKTIYKNLNKINNSKLLIFLSRWYTYFCFCIFWCMYLKRTQCKVKWTKWHTEVLESISKELSKIKAVWFVLCLDFQYIYLHNKSNSSSSYRTVLSGVLATTACCVRHLCQEALYLDLCATVDT